jgi:arginine/ornithine N-succinyltransferase beta subunit
VVHQGITAILTVSTIFVSTKLRQKQSADELARSRFLFHYEARSGWFFDAAATIVSLVRGYRSSPREEHDLLSLHWMQPPTDPRRKSKELTV